MARTIQSPGVEINEIDLSLRPVLPIGTHIMVPGFAAQGPTDELLEVASFSEFETVYGKPTNAAERYFYHTVKSIFNSDANVLTTRLPYGSAAGLGFGDSYSALFFPCYPYNGEQALPTTVHSAGASLSGVGDTGGTGYVFGRPTLVELSKEQYDLVNRRQFSWTNHVKPSESFSNDHNTWGKAGMIITNKAKTTINDKYEGYYITLTDNSQMNPATDFDSVNSFYSVNASSNGQNLVGNPLVVPAERRNFSLSGTATDSNGNVSEKLENLPTFDVSSDEFKDTAILGLFKMRTSVFSTDTLKLDNVLAESYMGSLDGYRKLQNQNGGTPKTFFLGDIEDGSPNLEVIINPNISLNTGTWANSANNEPNKMVRFLSQRALTDSASTSLSSNFGVPRNVLTSLHHASTGLAMTDALLPLGLYQPANPVNKIVGSVPTKVRRVMDNLLNVDAQQIDVSVEAGLGTVYAGSEYQQLSGTGLETFDDTLRFDMGDYSNSTGLYKLSEGVNSDASLHGEGYNLQQNYRAVFNEFQNFAEFKRKDHIFIADTPRWIFVQGRNDKVLNDKTRVFTQAVYWPLRHVYGSINTSFATVYGNWARVYDGTSDTQIWAPFSGVAAATFANTDNTYDPWWAPAGFTRGRFGGVNDLAVIPAQKHRDQLYRISINPVHQFPNEGFVIWGQKTMFKKPSAFDRINVRRLFLYLEKLVRQTMKFYVFEPNTVLTRTQVLNNLTPIFDRVKNQQGLYDFLIVCDERNNTPDIIDQNELVIDIYLKPVRAAEFILVNFYATRTGQDFTELVA